jgi:hypothetical protein
VRDSTPTDAKANRRGATVSLSGRFDGFNPHTKVVSETVSENGWDVADERGVEASQEAGLVSVQPVCAGK